MRDLDSLAVRELPGTEGARQPFWSPDSAFIGYHVVQGAQASVWKVEPRAGRRAA
ncbi:MAG: hypothetical protein HYS05_21270 [Acidobacteria bacterium]|nr:hypothetical protein [Acidobacteriota bacterium]